MPLTTSTYRVTVSKNNCTASDNVIISVFHSVLKGKFYNDLNNNGMKDANETYYSNGLVNICSSKPNYITFTFNGYEMYSDTGTFIIKPVIPQYYTAKPDSYIVKLSSLSNIDSLKDFGFNIVDKVDLGIKLTTWSHTWTRFSQGKGGVYEIRYYNNGSTVKDGCIKVVKDTRLVKTNKNIGIGG